MFDLSVPITLPGHRKHVVFIFIVKSLFIPSMYFETGSQYVPQTGLRFETILKAHTFNSSTQEVEAG